MGCGNGADKPAGGEDPVPAALARASSAQVGALGEETGVINSGTRQHGGKLNLSARASVVMVEVSQEVEMNALLVVGLVAGTRYSLLSSMTCRRHSSAGISNDTPRTRLGG